MSSETILVIAGALSGLVEAIVGQPLDMLKTRHQVNCSRNEGIIQSISQIYREGGVFRFYRGMAAELVGIVPKSSGMYASYEIVRRKLASVEEFGDSSLTCALSGLFSGVPEACIVQPTQVIKVRLQAKEHLGKYSGSIDCLRKIVRTEGLMALTIGLGPTIYRNSSWNSIYFGSMHWLKTLLPVPKSHLQENALTLVTGFCGAVVATAFTTPFDVVKSRFQSQMPIEVSPATATSAAVFRLKYHSTFQTLVLICREEGLASCYKGFTAGALRMGLGGGVAMTTFELVQYVDKNNLGIGL